MKWGEKMGKRGPKQGTGGRPRKALVEKILQGTTKYDKAVVLNFKNSEDLEGSDMPSPREYLSQEQKMGGELLAKEIYENAWEWLHQRGCAHLVYHQLLEQYAMSAARWIQMEKAISEFGFLSKHPTTGSPIQSPFVAMSQSFMKLATIQWANIYQIVRENCQSGFEGRTPQDDVMERLLLTGRP